MGRMILNTKNNRKMQPAPLKTLNSTFQQDTTTPHNHLRTTQKNKIGFFFNIFLYSKVIYYTPCNVGRVTGGEGVLTNSPTFFISADSYCLQVIQFSNVWKGRETSLLWGVFLPKNHSTSFVFQSY